MQRWNKAIAGTLAGALTTAIAAVFPELPAETVGAIGTLLTALFVYFAPANKEPLPDTGANAGADRP